MPQKSTRKNPTKTTKVERFYERQLRKIAKHVGDIINAYPAGDPIAAEVITQTLAGYADIITGWATATAGKMLKDVARADENAWRERAKDMSLALQEELRNAPTGEVMRALLREQVTLIKSIPTDAAKRVQKLTIEGQEDATRATEIAAEIAKSGQVAASHAKTIARTEVARTSSKLTEARSLHVGADEYIWRTSGDGDVRESHREMNGRVFRWDSPPLLSDGTRTHPGQIYNCRCYAEPIIPDD